jgi:hypothetical protein
MIVERPQTLFWKKLAAHAFLIAFIALILFPFLIVVSISLRPGNFSTGSLIPNPISLEHWSLALGIPFETPQGQMLQPPFPVMLWLWNSVKIGMIASAGILVLSMTAAYAFSRIRFAGRRAILDSLLIIQMFPAALTVIALYTIFDALGNITPVSSRQIVAGETRRHDDRRNKHKKGVDVRRAFLIDKRRVDAVFDQGRLMFHRFMDDGVEPVLGHDLQQVGHELLARQEIFIVRLIGRNLGPAIARAPRDFLKLGLAHGLPARGIGRLLAPLHPGFERFLFVLKIRGALG